MDLVTPDAMREMDKRTIEEVKIPGVVLMDRAARGAVDALLHHFSLSPGASIGLLCGTGNNGGDGLAMASMLAHRGFRPQVIVLGEKKDLSGDAALYFRVAEEILPELWRAPDSESLQQALSELPLCELWCDALLGTGLDRAVTGRYGEAIDFLENCGVPVVAVDIPSGIDGRTGQVLGRAASAELTTTFGFAKIGQCLDPARQLCGTLSVIDIGIPHHIKDAVGVSATGLDETWFSQQISPRPLDFHKGDAGRTLHIGGLSAMSGAIALSARAALVGGTGLITVISDRQTSELIPVADPEIMARGLIDTANDTLDNDAITAQLERADTVVIGPGLGTHDLGLQLMRLTLNSQPDQLIIDADGLNLISTHSELAELLKEVTSRIDVVLTPHPGEMARLQQVEITQVLQDPVKSAQELAHTFECISVLKTAATVICDAKGQLAINRSGNPGMATGGMGDALTGLIAAAAADFPDDPFRAAACGVYIHGRAGDLGAKKYGHRGLTVRRLLDEVPSVWQSFSP